MSRILLLFFGLCLGQAAADERPAAEAALRQAAAKLDEANRQLNLSAANHQAEAAELRRQIEALGDGLRDTETRLDAARDHSLDLNNDKARLEASLAAASAPVLALDRELKRQGAAGPAEAFFSQRLAALQQAGFCQRRKGSCFSTRDGHRLDGGIIDIGGAASLFLSREGQHGGWLQDGALLEFAPAELAELVHLNQTGTGRISAGRGLPPAARLPEAAKPATKKPVPKAVAVAPVVKHGPLQEILSGGWVMMPLLALGFLCFLGVVAKCFDLLRQRGIGDGPLLALEAQLAAGDIAAAEATAAAARGPAAVLMRCIIDKRRATPERMEEILHEELLGQMPRLDRGLPLIAIGAAAAPLLGLLGTVSGIISTFRSLGLDQAQSHAFAAGIAEALVTTKFGLIVAIFCLLSHALLNRRVRTLSAALEKSTLAYLNAAAMRRGDAHDRT